MPGSDRLDRSLAVLHAAVRGCPTILSVCVLVGCESVRERDDAAPVEDVGGGASIRLPDVSGMARWGDSYVIVHDSRDRAGPRAAVLHVGTMEAPWFREVPIRDEGLAGGHLADIEAIAAVPGRPSEFLALESGAASEGDQARRLLVHLRVATAADGQDELRLAGFVDVRGETAGLENCEGMVCWAHGEELRVLVADRGRVRPRRAAPRVSMIAGTLELDDVGESSGASFGGAAGGREGDGLGAASTMRFTPVVDQPPYVLDVPLKSSGTWRLCSDLHLDGAGILWGACAQDLGMAGPFRSKVYRAGVVDAETGWPRLRRAVFEHDIDGLKVEALAACDLPRASMCFATDDELYGGVWRPLLAEGDDAGR